MSGGDARLRELERRGLAGDMDAWRRAMRERIRRGLGPLVERDQRWRLRLEERFDRRFTADVFLVRPDVGVALVFDNGSRGPNKAPPGFEQGHGFPGYAVRWGARVPGGWQSGTDGGFRAKIWPIEFTRLDPDRDEAYRRAVGAATAELVVDDDLYQTGGPMENPRRKNPDDELRRLEREYATTKDPILLRRIRAERARRGVGPSGSVAEILSLAESMGAVDPWSRHVEPRGGAAIAGIYFPPPNNVAMSRAFFDRVRMIRWHARGDFLLDYQNGADVPIGPPVEISGGGTAQESEWRPGTTVTLSYLDATSGVEDDLLHVDTTGSSDRVPVPVSWHVDALGRVQATPGSPLRSGWLMLPGDWLVDFSFKRRLVRIVVSARYTEAVDRAQAIELARDAGVSSGVVSGRSKVVRAWRRGEPETYRLHNNPGVKRNMDETTRRLERTGDPIEIVRQRLRSGKISPNDLRRAEALTWTNGPASSHGQKRFVRSAFGEQLLALIEARGEEPAWDAETIEDAEFASSVLPYLPNSQVVMSSCGGSDYGQWQIQVVDSPDSDEEVADHAELLQAYINESGAPKTWQVWADPVGWWYVRKLAYEKNPIALAWLAFLLRFNWHNAWEVLRYGHVFDDEKHPRASVRRKQLAEYVDALIGHLLGGPPL